jgi:hypothetical protein
MKADMLVEGSYLIETEKILEALKKSKRQKIKNNIIQVIFHNYLITCTYIP